jgi:uncharacterized protein YdhG (YjbR/CyaY superfamily)
MSVIDDYLKGMELKQKNELERIRKIALKKLPGAEEAISYGMPTIKLKGKSIIGFDAHKNHIGIYPYSGHVISEIEELKKYSTSAGAIREPLDDLLPEELIEKVIEVRLSQI